MHEKVAERIVHIIMLHMKKIGDKGYCLMDAPPDAIYTPLANSTHRLHPSITA